MQTDECLDGNAAAGTLSRVFSLDTTSATLVCDSCQRSGPMGELILYDHGPGKVMRCKSCGVVNLRVLEARGRLVLDLRGSNRLIFEMPENAVPEELGLHRVRSGDAPIR